MENMFLDQICKARYDGNKFYIDKNAITPDNLRTLRDDTDAYRTEIHKLYQQVDEMRKFLGYPYVTHYQGIGFMLRHHHHLVTESTLKQLRATYPQVATLDTDIKDTSNVEVGYREGMFHIHCKPNLLGNVKALTEVMKKAYAYQQERDNTNARQKDRKNQKIRCPHCNDFTPHTQGKPLVSPKASGDIGDSPWVVYICNQCNKKSYAKES